VGESRRRKGIKNKRSVQKHIVSQSKGEIMLSFGVADVLLIEADRVQTGTGLPHEE
jgi:hypothetical protein